MILAPPGRYAVRMRVGGAEFTQPLTVLMDPDSKVGVSELAAQTAMLRDLATDLASSTALTAGIEGVRGQLRTLLAKLASDAANQDVRSAADSVERKFMLVADSLVQQNPGAFYEWPQKLSAKISYLASEVQGSDHQPTAQAREADGFLKSQLKLVRSEYAALLGKDLAALNDLLRRRGMAPVLTTQP
jgi:hypothetical protein